MLTKKDLQAIGKVFDQKIKVSNDKQIKSVDQKFIAFEKVVDNKITKALMDFFEQILAPYLDKRFGEVDKRFDGHDKKFDEIEVRLDKIDRKLEKHDTYALLYPIVLT